MTAQIRTGYSSNSNSPASGLSPSMDRQFTVILIQGMTPAHPSKQSTPYFRQRTKCKELQGNQSHTPFSVLLQLSLAHESRQYLSSVIWVLDTLSNTARRGKQKQKTSPQVITAKHELNLDNKRNALLGYSIEVTATP